MSELSASIYWTSGYAWGALTVCIIWLLTKMEFH
jgi:hypothetical protein